MIWAIIEIVIVLAGIASGAVLYYRFPVLPGLKKDAADFPSVSVIIPARNEEKNLPLLLSDLKAQTVPAYEIICVDDASEDTTAQIAAENGVKLITLSVKPEGWTGKTWACQNGADSAKGELLLFLDADVRLGREAIHTLLRTYKDEGCAVSVQPYHKTEKCYEQMSMLFNLVQIAANGTALPKPLTIGLYGPVILITKQDYNKAGGHKSVRKSIVEDMALGMRLKKAGLSYRLFIGNQNISFRMYGSGFRSFLQGWTKNMAAGAAKTPLPVFIMVFLWISSLASVALHLITFAVSTNWVWLAICTLFYMVWVFILTFLAKRVGQFSTWACVFYPIALITFLGVLFVSLLKKLFGLKVTWKGRSIETGEK